MKKDKMAFIIISSALFVLIIYSIVITIQFNKLDKRYKLVLNNYTEVLKFDNFNDREVLGIEIISMLNIYKDQKFSILVRKHGNEKYFNYGVVLQNTDENNLIDLPKDYKYYSGLLTTNKINWIYPNIEKSESNEYVTKIAKYNSKLIKDYNEKIIGICFEEII